ncbi:hypothetical protein FEM48_Zijuj09G0125600 [Ziziphus jujuba var. spinosa]|uniref:Uncharacterized protein n=1 Tax=Ziziphus jujuba var. spinosa TaxID=714518 RepID=A0A978UT13_ZIZJJ|nr:hypothetical protein FEM48_Zijuj09G0125600 [Ziziphus jujuba var. spinosa]
MESGTLDELRIFFFPFMAQGHIIPTIDMAMVFASRGSKATIITTPFHAPLFSKTIQKTNFSGTHINILTFKFPSVENGLPEGCESLHMANSPELQPKFFKAITTLGPQLDQLLEQHRPDCLVADTFFPWATDIAARYEIPRLIFHGTCYFSLCASLCVFRYKPYKSVFSETEPFIIPNLPGEIKFTRNQLPDFVKNDEETEFTEVYKAAKEVESRSYGVLVNSFYELEPVYADHYSKGLGFKAWHIGPLFLYKKSIMATETDPVHVLFFPLMAQGHILPTIDMSKLFAQRGVKTTIITTPLNAPLFTKTIEKSHNSNLQISLKVIEFPAKEAGLPEGVENLDLVTNMESTWKFFNAISLLQHTLDHLLQELRPQGLVADMFFPWATDIASKYGIPRIVFHGTSFFSMCATDSLVRHQPHKNVSSETDPFVLPGLPDRIELVKTQIPDNARGGSEDDNFKKLLQSAKEAEKRSFGILVNSFYELEPAYADHYRNVLGKKAWHIDVHALKKRIGSLTPSLLMLS